MAANEAFEWTARVIAVHSSDVERAADALCAEPENVCVDHRRRQLAMTKQFLDRANVLAALEQMRGERVPLMPRAA